jgi:hypothetical protein
MTTGALRLGSNREWFVDPRGPERRLQVTCHGETHRVVLSVWNGNACAATFQLPLDDAPRLIAHLADCLSVGLEGRAPETTSRSGSLRVTALDRARTALGRLAARLPRRQQ